MPRGIEDGMIRDCGQQSRGTLVNTSGAETSGANLIGSRFALALARHLSSSREWPRAIVQRGDEARSEIERFGNFAICR